MDERDRRHVDGDRKHASPDRDVKEAETDQSRRRDAERDTPALTPREREERWPVG